MAKKNTRVSNTNIDLSEYTAIPKLGLEGSFEEVRSTSRVTMPCMSLGWCPFGRLSMVFPANAAEAEALGLDDYRYPNRCSRTQKHCPVYYLAHTPVIGTHNPNCPSLKATVLDCNADSDCLNCAATDTDDCPHGADWNRQLLLDLDGTFLRQVEVDNYIASGKSEEFSDWLNELAQEVLAEQLCEVRERVALGRIALGG